MRVSELYSRNETGLLATSCKASLSISSVAPSSAPRGTRQTAAGRLPAPDADVVGARQTAAHQHAAAGRADVRIVRSAGGHGQIQIAIFENLRPLAVPVPHDVGHALAADLGDEEAAIEQDGVRAPGRRFPEMRSDAW